MTDKEKQIEEMAKVLHDRIVNQTWRADKVAKELYEIVVPKDSVVLSKEVFEDYMRGARQVEEGAEVCYNCHNEYAEKIDQARKETAREFYIAIIALINNAEDKLPKILPNNSEYKKGYENSVKHFKESIIKTAKQFGVEVEE